MNLPTKPSLTFRSRVHARRNPEIQSAGYFYSAPVAFVLFLVLFLSPGISTSANSRYSLPTEASRARISDEPQDKIDAPALELGKPIERELAGGQAHHYSISLVAAQYVHLLLDQRDIDVSLELLDPAGRKLAPIDSPGVHRGGLREIYLIASISGVCTIRVRPVIGNATTGRYSLTLAEMRIPTADDNNRAAAHIAFVRGHQMWLLGTQESYRYALAKYDESLRLAQTVHDSQQVTRAKTMKAAALGQLAVICTKQKKFQEAIDLHMEALQISRDLRHQILEASILSELGRCYFTLGSHRQASRYVNEAIPLLGKITGDDADLEIIRASAIFISGGIAFQQGETMKALEQFDRARQIFRDLKDRVMESQTLTASAMIYTYIKRPEIAAKYYSDAEQVRATATLTQEISDIEKERIAGRKSYEEAMQVAVPWTTDASRAAIAKLEIAAASYHRAREPMEEANALTAIGGLYTELNENERALEYFKRAAQLWPEDNPLWKIVLLLPMGKAYYALGRMKEALDALSHVIEMSQTVGDRNAEANALYLIARAKRDQGDPVEARSQVERSIKLFESLRAGIAGLDWRASFYASKREVYEFYVDLLMRMHKLQPSAGLDSVALEASERAHARSLNDGLSEIDEDIRQGADAELLKRERYLRQAINTKSEAMRRNQTSDEAAAFAAEIDGLMIELKVVEASIRAKSANAVLDRALSVKELQEQLLDPDSLLLEYMLGNERSYLWAVTPTSMSSYELPGRAEVERVALLFYGNVAAANQSDALQQQDLETNLRLSRMLLGPVASKLRRKRLLIVADGALQSVPFAALLDPASLNKKLQSRRPLIVNHEIVGLPSMSVLQSLRKRIVNRPPASRTLAVFADPVFSFDDRVKRPAGQEKRGLKGQYLEESFEPLPGTRQEAERILALFPREETLRAFGFDANRSLAMSGELSRYRYLHFATHAKLNTDRPELSAIMLSMFQESGEAQNGDLRFHEILNLKLASDLVVLSACKTGLGKEIRGEGLIGLTSSFMHAGAARVVASLWKVKDEATAKLMTSFYRGIIKERKRPAEALRAAQIEMLKQQRGMAPYHWAAFLLQGEWR